MYMNVRIITYQRWQKSEKNLQEIKSLEKTQIQEIR